MSTEKNKMKPENPQNGKNKDSKPPNILFILIDDMGWKDLGCYGSSFYETPNLDNFETQGMKFTDAYAACPVCSPTRASILTGKYPATLQLTNYLVGHANGKLLSAPYIHHLPLEEKTIATCLKKKGYNTYHLGKWHCGEEAYWPKKHGFDKNIGGCSWGHPNKGYFSPYGIPTLEDGPKGEYLTDRLTNEAISLFEESGDSPFFMYLSYYSVHTPIQAPKELVKKYEKKRKRLGLHKQKEVEKGEHFPSNLKRPLRIKRRLIQSHPEYAAMIERLDWNIGRVLNTLDELGITENTIIFFTSDNGGLATAEGSPTSNKPLAEGKGWMYEGGTREPLLVRWPGITEPGSECDFPVSSPDFFPTILEMAGMNPLEHTPEYEGKSLVPILKGINMEEQFGKRSIFWHYPHYGNQGGTPGSSIRKGDYKLIQFFEDDSIELYNLRDDIGEERNLVDEKHEKAWEMKKELVAWREKINAQIPKENPNYKPYGLAILSKLRWLWEEIKFKLGR